MFKRYELHNHTTDSDAGITCRELIGIMDISARAYTVRLGYICDESEREAVTAKLHNAMQLLLEEENLSMPPAGPAVRRMT